MKKQLLALSLLISVTLCSTAQAMQRARMLAPAIVIPAAAAAANAYHARTARPATITVPDAQQSIDQSTVSQRAMQPHALSPRQATPSRYQQLIGWANSVANNWQSMVGTINAAGAYNHLFQPRQAHAETANDEEKTQSTTESNTPQQQQIMHPAQVLKTSSTDQLKKDQAITLFMQDAQTFKSENAKIPPKTTDNFRIMTYNVHYWASPPRKCRTPYEESSAPIWHVIDQVNPDVLILEEAAAWHQKGHFKKSRMYQELKKRGYNHISACNAFSKNKKCNHWFGNIIASKVEYSKAGRVFYTHQERPGKEDRCFCSMALVLPNGEKLTIYGTHLEVGKQQGHNDEIRFQQVKQLSNHILQNHGQENALIVGDFNATRNEKSIKHLTSNDFKDGFSALHWQQPQFTCWAGTEIDFMFLNPNWQLPLAGCYIYYDAASDHLPIIMDIKVN